MGILISDVADYLEINSLGTVGTDIFCGRLPDSPDDCISVHDDGGGPPDGYIPTRLQSFYVYVRATRYPDGVSRIDKIRDLLHRKSNDELVSGQTFLFYVLAKNDGGHIGRDENGRDIFRIDFNCMTR